MTASYATAMRTFATCADKSLELPGYCHGSLMGATQLANHQVCQGAADDDISDLASSFPLPESIIILIIMRLSVQPP